MSHRDGDDDVPPDGLEPADGGETPETDGPARAVVRRLTDARAAADVAEADAASTGAAAAGADAASTGAAPAEAEAPAPEASPGGPRATDRADRGPVRRPPGWGSPGTIEAPRTEARLARIHLRLSMHAIARAELETLAAHGSLDVHSLRDLAEVRWRTGDLVGAGEAAEACLEAGGDDLVVLCIAAEAAAAGGRMAAARHLAARVLARGRDRLDDLFAGQPRSAIWPEMARPVPAPATVERDPSSVGASAARPSGVAGPTVPSPIIAASASADLAEAQARIASGDLDGVAARLSLVLRAQPVLAPAVLAVAEQALRAPGVGSEAAPLHLVRGDAYRLLGRETLAAEAFQQSSLVLRGTRPSEETP